MPGLATIPPVRADRVLPAYVFSGEDLFAARRFVRDLRQALTTTDGETVQVETFNLDVHGWREILDVAKCLPFFFAPRRLLVVEGKGAGQEGLSSGEAAAFRDYFAAPTDRTTIVVLFEGKIHKTKPLGKALDALPDSVALAVELHPLKDKDLKPWIEDRFEALGKRATPEAIERLLDIAGSDLGRLEAEVEKITTFIGPRKSVEGDDVSALSTVKNFESWELKDALEKGATDKALVILKSQFDDGQAPELIFSGLIGFFRDLLLARSGLREGRDPKDIFREIKPQISEKFGSFYQTKLREFFDLVGRISDADLLRRLGELERIDLRIKTMGMQNKDDKSIQTVIEAFIVDFGRPAGGRRITSSGRG
jgi:DNA polymerase-3 subunit delta